MSLERTDAYDYELPGELVASEPTPSRTASRLLVGDVERETFVASEFARLATFLDPGDLLVFNDTRVVPARIQTRKSTGGAVELFVVDVLEPSGPDRWSEPTVTPRLRCMTRSSKKLRAGQVLTSADGTEFRIERWEAGLADVTVDVDGSVEELLERVGETPLPPYIVRRREELGEEATREEDLERYQTVYARHPGAVAAPTAGLHFDGRLLAELDDLGVERATLTLHVGPGTFRPVTAERLSDHPMHTEEYEIPPGLRQRIEETRGAGKRVVAVGTTTVRTMEAEARLDEPLEPGRRSTDIFIRPGFDFRLTDAMITNFHLPKSTLLALVYAFAGADFVRRLYEEAIRERYRFYSYGDAMLLGRGW